MTPGGGPVGVVLAGGLSSRMGTDKALLEVDGVAMALRVANALLSGGCGSVWCQGGDRDRLAALGLEVRDDPQPHAGPVAAIVAALDAAAPADVVVCACDLPAIDGDVVAALVGAGSSSDAPLVTVATDEHGYHLAGWWSSAAREPLAALRREGVLSYREAVGRLGARSVPVATTSVRNVNRPADLG